MTRVALRRAWRELGRPVQVVVVAMVVISAVPPATNLGPGMAGYALVLVVLAVVTLWLLDGGPALSWTPGRISAKGPAVAVVALIGWMIIGVLRAGDQWDTAGVATLLALLAALGPWALARRVTGDEMACAVIALCAAVVLGSAVAAWVVPLMAGQGLSLRPGLPIGGASNNGVGLSLALAGTLVGARRWPSLRLGWWVLAALAGLLLVQSASRAGWIMALVVVLAAGRVHHRWSPRRVATVGIVGVVVALGGLALLRGPQTLVDSARWDNAARGLEAWSSSAGSVLLGHGSMQVWPWLATEHGWAQAGVRGTTLPDGPWGQLLYHAHSTYLVMLVEYGLIGLGLLLAVLWFVGRRCLRHLRRRSDLALVAVAVLLALPAMAVELYLVRSFPSAVLWWAAVLALGRDGPDDEAQREGGDEDTDRTDQRDRSRDQLVRGQDIQRQPQDGDRAHGPGQVHHLTD